MKKLLTLLLALPLAWGHAAAQENAKYTILLTGASFASPQNGWFEIGCRQLDARALNRAIGGESIADTANRMADIEIVHIQILIDDLHRSGALSQQQVSQSFGNLFLELLGTLFPLDHHHSGPGIGLAAPEEGDLIVFDHDPFLRNGDNGRHSFSDPGSQSGGFFPGNTLDNDLRHRKHSFLNRVENG